MQPMLDHAVGFSEVADGGWVKQQSCPAKFGSSAAGNLLYYKKRRFDMGQLYNRVRGFLSRRASIS